MKEHWARFVAAIVELGHSYTNLFVEFLRTLKPFQKQATFYRPDKHDHENKWVKDEKDLAYWLGHVLMILSLVGFGFFIYSVC